jgi:hypothetical protein
MPTEVGIPEPADTTAARAAAATSGPAGPFGPGNRPLEVLTPSPEAGPGQGQGQGPDDVSVVPFPRRGAAVPPVPHDWRAKPALTAVAVLLVAAAGVAVAVSWPSTEQVGHAERFPDVAVVTPSAKDVEPPAVEVPATPAPTPTLVPTVAGAFTSIPVDVPDGREPATDPTGTGRDEPPGSAPVPTAAPGPTRSPAPKPPTAPTTIPPPTTPPATTEPPIIELPPIIVPPPIIGPPAPAPAPTEESGSPMQTAPPASKTGAGSSAAGAV